MDKNRLRELAGLDPLNESEEVDAVEELINEYDNYEGMDHYNMDEFGITKELIYEMRQVMEFCQQNGLDQAGHHIASMWHEFKSKQ